MAHGTWNNLQLSYHLLAFLIVSSLFFFNAVLSVFPFSPSPSSFPVSLGQQTVNIPLSPAALESKGTIETLSSEQDS